MSRNIIETYNIIGFQEYFSQPLNNFHFHAKNNCCEVIRWPKGGSLFDIIYLPLLRSYTFYKSKSCIKKTCRLYGEYQ